MSITMTAQHGFAPTANGDRTRAMSVEELAAWIIRMQSADLSNKWCNDTECGERMDNEGFACTDKLRGRIL